MQTVCTHPSLHVPGFGDGGDVAGRHQHAAVDLLGLPVVPRRLAGLHHGEVLLPQSETPHTARQLQQTPCRVQACITTVFESFDAVALAAKDQYPQRF